MGEGWSDWYAKDFIVGQFPALDTATPGEIDMGDYVDLGAARDPRARRSTAPSRRHRAAVSRRPAARGAGGFTYGDFGEVNGEPEVHGDGEIWAADAVGPARRRSAPTNARRLITQGMRLSPPEPSFLDMRNAILQADEAAGGDAAHADLDGVRAPRHGLLRRPPTTPTTSRRSRTSRCRRRRRPARPDRRARDRRATGQPVAGARAAIGGLEDGPDALVGHDRRRRRATRSSDVPRARYPSVMFGAPGYDRLIRPVDVPRTRPPTLQRRRCGATGRRSRGGVVRAVGDAPFARARLRAGGRRRPARRHRLVDAHERRPSTMVVTLPRAVDVDALRDRPDRGVRQRLRTPRRRLRDRDRRPSSRAGRGRRPSARR